MVNKYLIAYVILVGMIIFSSGCNQIENLSTSGTKLICSLITGNDEFGQSGSTTIMSDVITTGGTIYNDVAVATLTTTLLDPDKTESTFYQDVIVDQIDIRYTRADGLNVEGVDVPFSFSQKVNERVSIGIVKEMGFVLIQQTAKLESPLVELVNFGQEKILKLEAECTFYGKDLAGNRVEPAVATVSIWAADFADEE